ncbi:response regulator [Falsiroseomonas sp. HW251]|uniref:response regulator n=1 Tax=Falsiroseomonas sp. HW251 TaxID=3390998 RepID=UPI003D3187E3
MRALVVEDDEFVRRSVCDFLTEDGVDCEEAGSAAAAMALLARDDGWEPDVLVTDFDLGAGPTGEDLAYELLRRLPGLGVVHATGSPECLALHEFTSRERLLPKPFSARGLSAAVHEVAAFGTVIAAQSRKSLIAASAVAA